LFDVPFFLILFLLPFVVNKDVYLSWVSSLRSFMRLKYLQCDHIRHFLVNYLRLRIFVLFLWMSAVYSILQRRCSGRFYNLSTTSVDVSTTPTSSSAAAAVITVSPSGPPTHQSTPWHSFLLLVVYQPTDVRLQDDVDFQRLLLVDDTMVEAVLRCVNLYLSALLMFVCCCFLLFVFLLTALSKQIKM